MSPGRKPSWTVEIRDGVEPFAAEWAALVRADNATPFQNFGLMRLFYRQLAENGLAKPVVALARHPDGRPAALLPLLGERRRGLAWLRSDARPIDYCAPVFDPALSPADARDIVQAVLKAAGASLLYCNKMPVRFGTTLNPLAALPDAARLRFSAWRLPLAGEGEAALLALQNPKQRNNLRRSHRRLAAAHDRRFHIAFGRDITPGDFATFLALRAESTGEKGWNDILDDPRWTDFYARLAAGETGDACIPWLSWLKADGAPIAVLFGFVENGHAVAIMPASKGGEWKTYSPGLQLFEDTILAFAARGAACFDLSIGDMPYKRRLGCDELPLHDALFARGPAGRLYKAVWRLKIAIRNRMKPIAAA